jgi:riboflavin kinase/FMN adenylyltransferase
VQVIHFPGDLRPLRFIYPVLALGNFDGLHRGHLKIIERVKKTSNDRGGTAMAMTFDPHPPKIIRPDKAPKLLMTTEQRLEALQNAGVEVTVVVNFTYELSRLKPEKFVKEVLVEWLKVAEVLVGSNFLFGRDRTGNFSLLRRLGQEYGFRTDKIEPVRYKQFVVSSTRVRRLVSEGKVDEAAALLGHSYWLNGKVVQGEKRGRELGYPTANIVTNNALIPPNGVYATTLEVGGISRASLTNIGVRPTYSDNDSLTIETYMLNHREELYGSLVRLGFVQRLRDEKKFNDIDSLRAQIKIDEEIGRRLFDRLSV